jgi:hypothetical protein
MFSPPTLITSVHEVRNFDCGQPALNDFLIKHALANTSAGLARTFVVTPLAQPVVAGYFSIAAGSVERENAPERVAKGTPRQSPAGGVAGPAGGGHKISGSEAGPGPAETRPD